MAAYEKLYYSGKKFVRAGVISYAIGGLIYYFGDADATKAANASIIVGNVLTSIGLTTLLIGRVVEKIGPKWKSSLEDEVNKDDDAE